MNFFLGFSFIDPSVGKIDKHLLSQQTLMELLIEGIQLHKKIICGSTENPKDISEWKDLKFNASDEIIEIDWSWEILEGTIELKWLPFSLEKVDISWNNLSGTADLTCLPQGLRELNLENNLFEGMVDLTKLPAGLTNLDMHDNKFRGSTDFSQLPKSLIDLDISNTELEGKIFSFDGDLEIEDSNVLDMRNKKY